ncbi:MAG TPA: hypothetical protein VMN39_02290 [Longimicrobiaceae bacterium]|nr:hypothetical protein [Longimicrobiaceae bacterium]
MRKEQMRYSSALPSPGGLAGRLAAWTCGAVLATALLAAPAIAQGLTFNKGQSISPAYEGWTQNEDGSFNLLFGYMNRNWEEQPDIPIGPDNVFSPGPADRGQPTHFLPRRNRFIFEVTVPADFGDRELVWTINHNGEAMTAYGSLRPDYFIDNVVIMSENGALGPGTSSPELREHTPPTVHLQTPTVIEARVGEPVQLVAYVTDDGLPRRREVRVPVTEGGDLDYERAIQMIPSRITVEKIVGLHMTWFVYRGPQASKDAVRFDPPQIHAWEDTRPYSNSPWAAYWNPPEPPEDGIWIAEVTFDQPGTYVLRGRADDGGLYTDTNVTVHVRK